MKSPASRARTSAGRPGPRARHRARPRRGRREAAAGTRRRPARRRDLGSPPGTGGAGTVIAVRPPTAPCDRLPRGPFHRVLLRANYQGGTFTRAISTLFTLIGYREAPLTLVGLKAPGGTARSPGTGACGA